MLGGTETYGWRLEGLVAFEWCTMETIVIYTKSALILSINDWSVAFLIASGGLSGLIVLS
jgi:hypothetical protein